MKATEVIKELYNLIQMHGDLEVYSCDPNNVDHYSWQVNTVAREHLVLQDDEELEDDESDFPTETPCFVLNPL